MATIDQTRKNPEILVSAGRYQVSIIDYQDDGFGLIIHGSEDHKFVVYPDGYVKSIKEKNENNHSLSSLSVDGKNGAMLRLESLRNAAQILLEHEEASSVTEDFCDRIIDTCDEWMNDIMKSVRGG